MLWIIKVILTYRRQATACTGHTALINGRLQSHRANSRLRLHNLAVDQADPGDPAVFLPKEPVDLALHLRPVDLNLLIKEVTKKVNEAVLQDRLL